MKEQRPIPERKKVYCIDCEFLKKEKDKPSGSEYSYNYNCSNKDVNNCGCNTWLEEEYKTLEPKDINIINQCEGFKSKKKDEK